MTQVIITMMHKSGYLLLTPYLPLLPLPTQMLIVKLNQGSQNSVSTDC